MIPSRPSVVYPSSPTGVTSNNRPFATGRREEGAVRDNMDAGEFSTPRQSDTDRHHHRWSRIFRGRRDERGGREREREMDSRSGRERERERVSRRGRERKVDSKRGREQQNHERNFKNNKQNQRTKPKPPTTLSITKNVPCKFYNIGKCIKGSGCRFLHPDPSEAPMNSSRRSGEGDSRRGRERERQGDSRRRREQQNRQRNFKNNNKQSQRAKPKPPTPLSVTINIPCKFYNIGKCSEGHGCRFLHPDPSEARMSNSSGGIPAPIAGSSGTGNKSSGRNPESFDALKTMYKGE